MCELDVNMNGTASMEKTDAMTDMERLRMPSVPPDFSTESLERGVRELTSEEQETLDRISDGLSRRY